MPCLRVLLIGNEGLYQGLKTVFRASYVDAECFREKTGLGRDSQIQVSSDTPFRYAVCPITVSTLLQH